MKELAIHPQTVYANLRGKPMGIDTLTPIESGAGLKQKGAPKVQAANGEQKKESQAPTAEQKTLQQLAKEKKQQTPRRVENVKRQLKPYLEDFQKTVNKLISETQITDVKREIVILNQAVSVMERGIAPQQREEIWQEVYKSIAPVYEALAQQGVEVDRFVEREHLVHETSGQLVLPPEVKVFEKPEVLANAKLEKEDRLKEAERLLRIELTPAQESAILVAHHEGKGGVYNYDFEDIRFKKETLAKAGFNKWQIRTLMEAGIAGVLPPETFADLPSPLDIANDALRNEIILFKATAEAGNVDENVIARRIQAIEDHVREGRVRAEEAAPIIANMEGWQIMAEAQPSQRGPQPEGAEENVGRRGRRRGMPEGLVERFLRAREAGTFDVGVYTNPVVGEIAQNVLDTMNSGDADNEYFKRRIGDLVDLRVNPAYADNSELLKQAGQLQGELQSLKDTLAAKIVTAEGAMHQSLYGELRLNDEEMEELVNLVLLAGNKREHETDQERAKREEADRDIDRKFNRLFARADINANDEWRDALGPAGSFEVDNFMMALGYAATGRALPQGQRLSPNEKEWLNTKIRQLEQEKKLRETLHSISYYVNLNFTVEDIAKVASNFATELADVAYSKKGVVVVSQLFEQAMYQVIARHGGFLPPESMINKIDGTPGEVEVLVRQQIKVAKEAGLLARDMEDWEINRAISLARGMGIMSARFFEIVARAGVPQENPLVGWWANDVIKKISFFKQVARYNIGHEANRFLCYKLEGGAPVWRLKELSEVTDDVLNDQIVFGMTDKDSDDRYISMVNPARIGSIMTQTKWRYGAEDIHNAGAIAVLLARYKTNPILGAGMWIEKERMNMKSTDKLSADDRATLHDEGVDVKTVGERAEALIRKNLELATKVTPLKLFYELPWFEKGIIEKYYIPSGRRSEYDALLRAKKYSKALELRREFVQEMDHDLTALAIVQGKLLAQRAEPFREYKQRLLEWEALDPATRGPQPRPPGHELNLYENLTDLPFDILGDTPEAQAQIQRLREFSSRIREEFLKPDNINHLIHDLKDKGWKVPYIFGTDDIPLDLYDWKATGPATYKRRWKSDIEAVSGAMDVFEKMLKQMPQFQDQDTIIKTLNEVHQTLSGHDENVSQEMMYRTIEGITKFYKKGFVNRFGFGIGTSVNILGGAASYAQLKFGRSAMAWDETNTYDFIHKARAANLITDEQLHKLEKSTGSRGIQVGIDVGRSLGPILFAAMALYLFTKVWEEK